MSVPWLTFVVFWLVLLMLLLLNSFYKLWHFCIPCHLQYPYSRKTTQVIETIVWADSRLKLFFKYVYTINLYISSSSNLGIDVFLFFFTEVFCSTNVLSLISSHPCPYSWLELCRCLQTVWFALFHGHWYYWVFFLIMCEEWRSKSIGSNIRQFYLLMPKLGQRYWVFITGDYLWLITRFVLRYELFNFVGNSKFRFLTFFWGGLFCFIAILINSSCG